MGGVRLLLAALILAIAWLSLASRLLSPAWILPAIAAFAAAVWIHALLRRRRATALRAQGIYRDGLARLNDAWTGRGVSGERYLNDEHPYAADLDLFGKGGLFELLCAARTRMGEDLLAQWLLQPAGIAEIRVRQACIADLRDRLELREKLALVEEPPAAGRTPDALLAWAQAPNLLCQRWIPWAARLLPLLFIATAVLWGLAAIAWPFVLVVAAEIAVLVRLHRPVDAALDGAQRALGELKVLTGVLTELEREPLASPDLTALQARLVSAGQSASRNFGQLQTLANLAESRENLAVRALLIVPGLFAVQVALRAERWRSLHGQVVRAWVDAAARFEALSSLARYGYEHPLDPFPTLLPLPSPCFAARGLGHPLLPLATCVRNDVELSRAPRILLVSGSNMSGKSTLLRSVGLNAVLAMAGAPVRAHSLTMTALQVGASIRVSDSLQEGISRFYAEIRRLRRLDELAVLPPPMLFLLDELLQGTNSHDRRIGAEAILRAYLAHGAIGLASTHDLALTQIEGRQDGSVRNVHFEDAVENGALRFDFRLRDGVITRSNGLALMRSLGLPV